MLGLTAAERDEPRAGLAYLEQALCCGERSGPHPYGEGAVLNNRGPVSDPERRLSHGSASLG